MHNIMRLTLVSWSLTMTGCVLDVRTFRAFVLCNGYGFLSNRAGLKEHHTWFLSRRTSVSCRTQQSMHQGLSRQTRQDSQCSTQSLHRPLAPESDATARTSAVHVIQGHPPTCMYMHTAFYRSAGQAGRWSSLNWLPLCRVLMS